MKTVQEVRRPGIDKITAAIKQQYPLWSVDRVQCEAKVRWTALYRVTRPKSALVILEAHELLDFPCPQREVERILRDAGVPATVRPSGELHVTHGRLDAKVSAERTAYRWWAEGTVPA